MNQTRENIIKFVSSTEGLRQRNRALVLSTIRTINPATHATITEAARLSTGTVSTVLSELVAEGLLSNDEGHKSGRGRPVTAYRPNPDAARVAHVRITADKVTFSMVDFAGTLQDQISLNRNNPTVRTFQEVLRQGLERLVKRAKVDLCALNWVLFTSKALLNQENGRMLWSPSFGGQAIDFAEEFPELEGRLSLKHEACSIAEHVLRDETATHQSQAVLWLGNSVGFGIAERQATGYFQTSSPALAHMSYKADGDLCCCGGHGCVEAHAGFHAILRRALEAPEIAGMVPAVPLDQMQRIADMARSGNPSAILAFRDAGKALGCGLSNIFMVSGVMPLLITGPGLTFFDLLQESLSHEIQNTLLARLGQKIDISFAQQEEALLLKSALDSCVQDLDSNIIATRQLVATPAKATAS